MPAASGTTAGDADEEKTDSEALCPPEWKHKRRQHLYDSSTGDSDDSDDPDAASEKTERNAERQRLYEQFVLDISRSESSNEASNGKYYFPHHLLNNLCISTSSTH